jgi:hypothetical protein
MMDDKMRRHAKAINGTRAATATGMQGTLPAVFEEMFALSNRAT